MFLLKCICLSYKPCGYVFVNMTCIRLYWIIQQCLGMCSSARNILIRDGQRSVSDHIHLTQYSEILKNNQIYSEIFKNIWKIFKEIQYCSEIFEGYSEILKNIQKCLEAFTKKREKYSKFPRMFKNIWRIFRNN